jgi:ketosteroid isomerase-like protein
MPSTEAEIAALMDRRSAAIETKDIDVLVSLYAPDVVYFDVVPPLRYVGSAAIRARFTDWLDGFDGPYGQEIRDLQVTASRDVAVASMLVRGSGTTKGGIPVDRWLRATSCCRRSAHGWSITHEHISVPVDLATGTVTPDLVP